MSSDEVCAKHGLSNTTIDYTEDNFHTWTTYKVFADNVRPLVLKVNPKVSMTRLVQLIAAKWREFVDLNPYRDQISTDQTSKKTKDGWFLFVCKIVTDFSRQ
jgi:chromodomain-helicase-DNA-binding protein 4